LARQCCSRAWARSETASVEEEQQLKQRVHLLRWQKEYGFGLHTGKRQWRVCAWGDRLVNESNKQDVSGE
jgi:hypothetical protein